MRRLDLRLGWLPPRSQAHIVARVRGFGSCASCLLLIALAWTTAAPSLDYEFVYDDVAVVVQRRPFWEEGLTAFFKSNHWGTGRQATLASLDLDRLWSAPGARAFHRTNALLAALIAVLVWALARRVSLSRLGALVAAALFAVHPVHVDAVVAVVGRAELLAALGVLVALLASIGPPPRADSERESSRPGSAALQAGRFALVLGASLLALFSKESAVCLPLLLLACRWALGARVIILPAAVAVALAVVVWVAAAGPFLGRGMAPEFVDNPLVSAPIMERIPKACVVLGEYLGLTLWPHPLRPDRSYAQTDPTLVAGYAALLGWLAYGAITLAMRGRSAVAALALAWFPLAFAVTGNIALPVSTIMAERLLFLPSLGPCLLAGMAVDQARLRGRVRHLLAVTAAAAVVAVFVPLFLARGAVWASGEVYFTASAAASPRSAKAWYDLGLWRSTRGAANASQQEAEAAWRRALDILPSFHRANYELAESLGRRGQPLAGAEVYERFLTEVPDDTGALTNVTRLLLDAGEPRRANAYAQRLVQLDPESLQARETLLLTEAAMLRKAQRERAPVNP